MRWCKYSWHIVLIKGRVKCETPEAILIQVKWDMEGYLCGTEVWLPKSKTLSSRTPEYDCVMVPFWLYKRKLRELGIKF